MGPPTPYDDLNAVLGALVEGVIATLGDRVVSMCLQGSFATGGFDQHSDVDFVVAVDGTLTDADVVALDAMHDRTFELPSRWAQHLEGSYFPHDVLRSCDRRAEELWYLDNGSRKLIRSDHCNTAVVRETVRAHGIRIAGAEPATLVDAIPVDVLRADMLTAFLGWGEQILETPDPWRNRFYQGFIVLGYCRMWRDLVAGAPGSKPDGAAWAKTRLDPEWSDLIDRAWATRPDPAVSVRQAPDPDDFARTLQLLELIMDECRSFASEHDPG